MEPLTTRARRLREASRAETRAPAFLWYAAAEGGRFSVFELLRMRKRFPRGWTVVDMVEGMLGGDESSGCSDGEEDGEGRAAWPVALYEGESNRADDRRYVTRLQNCLGWPSFCGPLFGSVGVALADLPQKATLGRRTRNRLASFLAHPAIRQSIVLFSAWARLRC